MVIATATWLLIISGIYTGSMAPGVEVTVLMSAPAEDARDCEDKKRSFVSKLPWLGVKVASARCRKI